MNKTTISVLTCLPLLFFMIPLAASTVPLQDLRLNQLQDRSLPKNDIDPAYRDDAGDDRETQLKKEQIRSAMAELEHKQKRVNEGTDSVLTQLECQKRLVTVLLDFHKEPNKIISLLEENVVAAKATEANRKLRYENGVGRPDDLFQATYFRADIELQLLRAKKKYGVGDGDGLARPELRLGDLPQDIPGRVDRLVLELENELRGSGQFYPSELQQLRRDNEYHVRRDNLIEEWKNGRFSPEPYRIILSDDEESRLKKQRINVALMEKEHFNRLQDAGMELLGVALESQKRLLAAQLDFHTDPQEIVSALQQAFEAAKQTEAIVQGQYDAGAAVNVQQVAQARGNRLASEIKMLRAKKKYGLLDDSPEKDKDVEADLKQQRITAALTELEHLKRLAEAGVGTWDVESQQRLLEAQLDFHTDPKEIVSALRQMFESAKHVELIAQDQFDAGAEVNMQQVAEAKGKRLAFEIKLLRAKKKYGLLEDSPEKDKDVEADLMQQRIKAALTEIEHFERLAEAGVETLDAAIKSQHRLLDAQLDFHTEPKEIVAALQQAFESAKQTEAIVQDQFRAGAEVNIQQVGQAAYNRLDCEIKLLRVKKKYKFVDGDGTAD